jgi:membrane protease YdiL (CAAX protease family)
VPAAAHLPALPRPGLWLSLGITVSLVLLQGFVGVVAAVALMVIGLTVTGHEPGERVLAMVLLPLGVTTVVLLALGAAALLYGRQARRVLALRPVAWPHLLIIVLAAPPFLVIAEGVAAFSQKYLPTFGSEMFADFSELPVALVLLFGGVGPAIGEEIIFRGILGRGLVARHGLWLGGMLAALFFGLVHVDPAQAVSVLCLGWILQGVYVATRSLVAPMLVHLLNNTMAFMQLKYYDPLADLEQLPLALLGAAGLALLGMGVVLYQVRARWTLADGTAWSPGYVTAEMPAAAVAAECRWRSPCLSALTGAGVAYAIFGLALCSSL